MIPTYILTNNNHLWLLNGFSYLWNKYCAFPVTIFGFKSPNQMHVNFQFESLGDQLPASQWSDSLLRMLDNIGHKYFILLLEDYWLYELVDRHGINNLQRFMTDDILRIDLSGNRASYKQSQQVGGMALCDPPKKTGYEFIPFSHQIVETPEGTPYQMSFQAAIWHKENMRKVLEKGESPWQAEINGSKRAGNLRVLGTNPALMKYQPVWRSQQQHWQLDKLKTDDLEFIKRRGWLDVPES